MSKEDAEKMGVTMKDPKDVTLETEYKKIAQVRYAGDVRLLQVEDRQTSTSQAGAGGW